LKGDRPKSLPEFASDEVAERFVDEADLTGFDLSGGNTIRFQRESEPKRSVRETGEMYKFEVYKDKAGEFRFRFKASNGETMFGSEGYKAKASALHAIESIKKHVPDANIDDQTTALA
jgi:uncharacterized protein YegP (UPF0339 family)